MNSFSKNKAYYFNFLIRGTKKGEKKTEVLFYFSQTNMMVWERGYCAPVPEYAYGDQIGNALYHAHA